MSCDCKQPGFCPVHNRLVYGREWELCQAGTPTTLADPGWGDRLEAALSAVGVTKERVSAWLGAPCGCAERQEKMNRLGRWVESFFKAPEAAKQEFERLEKG